MQTMAVDQPALLLAVVLPTRDQTCNFFSFTSEAAWREHQAPHFNVGDAHDQADGITSRVDNEDSECTEEERVAVEQLAHLRHIRDLSMRQGADDCSCSTGSHFIADDDMAAIPFLTSSHTSNHLQGFPTQSSSAAIGNHKTKQEDKQYVFQFQSNRGSMDSDAGEESKQHPEALSSCSANTHLACVNLADIDFADDGRKNPRSRLLSEIYQDELKLSEPFKGKKRRRRAVSRIMVMSH